VISVASYAFVSVIKIRHLHIIPNSHFKICVTYRYLIESYLFNLRSFPQSVEVKDGGCILKNSRKHAYSYMSACASNVCVSFQLIRCHVSNCLKSVPSLLATFTKCWLCSMLNTVCLNLNASPVCDLLPCTVHVIQVVLSRHVTSRHFLVISWLLQYTEPCAPS
jgi:hypothetical protein